MGNKEIAEDLTHDTFVRAKNSLPSFRGDATYFTWMISISRNVVYDYLRRKSKIRFIPFNMEHSNYIYETPEDILLQGEVVTEVFKAINKLKLNYKTIIILRKIQGLSVEESAAALGWSQSKVKSTTLRATEKLKQELSHLHEKGEEK